MARRSIALIKLLFHPPLSRDAYEKFRIFYSNSVQYVDYNIKFWTNFVLMRFFQKLYFVFYIFIFLKKKNENFIIKIPSSLSLYEFKSIGMFHQLILTNIEKLFVHTLVRCPLDIFQFNSISIVLLLIRISNFKKYYERN